MKEVIIKYKDSKTLELLKSLAEYLDFSVSLTIKNKLPKKEYDYINGVPVIRGDSSIDVRKLKAIFTGKNPDPKKLRTEGWERQK